MYINTEEAIYDLKVMVRSLKYISKQIDDPVNHLHFEYDFGHPHVKLHLTVNVLEEKDLADFLFYISPPILPDDSKEVTLDMIRLINGANNYIKSFGRLYVDTSTGHSYSDVAYSLRLPLELLYEEEAEFMKHLNSAVAIFEDIWDDLISLAMGKKSLETCIAHVNEIWGEEVV